MRPGSGPREGRLGSGPTQGLPGHSFHLGERTGLAWLATVAPAAADGPGSSSAVAFGTKPGWAFLSRQPSGTLYPFQVGLALQVPGEAGAGWGGAL